MLPTISKGADSRLLGQTVPARLRKRTSQQESATGAMQTRASVPSTTANHKIRWCLFTVSSATQHCGRVVSNSDIWRVLLAAAEEVLRPVGAGAASTHVSMCPGRFSDEIVKRLQEATTRDGLAATETLRAYRCNTCGRAGLMPMIDGREWRPSSHEPHPRKSENPSGNVPGLVTSEPHERTTADQIPDVSSGNLITT